jgi:hypothetical protein
MVPPPSWNARKRAFDNGAESLTPVRHAGARQFWRIQCIWRYGFLSPKANEQIGSWLLSHASLPPYHRTDAGQPDFDLQERVGVRGGLRGGHCRDRGALAVVSSGRLSPQPSPYTPEILMLSSSRVRPTVAQLTKGRWARLRAAWRGE